MLLVVSLVLVENLLPQWNRGLRAVSHTNSSANQNVQISEFILCIQKMQGVATMFSTQVKAWKWIE